MANRTVPAAAEGMSKPDFSDLEGVIDDAKMFAKLADYVAVSALGDTKPENACVLVTEWERDLALFATMKAVAAMEKVSSDFYELMGVAQ